MSVEISLSAGAAVDYDERLLPDLSVSGVSFLAALDTGNGKTSRRLARQHGRLYPPQSPCNDTREDFPCDFRVIVRNAMCGTRRKLNRWA